MVSGVFREDLYYRLKSCTSTCRRSHSGAEDIPLLVAHFLELIARDSNQRKIYAPEAVELLATAEWPGNIRQLYKRRAAQRRAVEESDHQCGTRAAGARRRPVEAPVFDEARTSSRALSRADPADHGRQREPGGPSRQAQIARTSTSSSGVTS